MRLRQQKDFYVQHKIQIQNYVIEKYKSVYVFGQE